MGFEDDKFYGEGICIQLEEESSNQFHVYIPVFYIIKLLKTLGDVPYSQGARFLKIDLAQLFSQKRFDFRNS